MSDEPKTLQPDSICLPQCVLDHISDLNEGELCVVLCVVDATIGLRMNYGARLGIDDICKWTGRSEEIVVAAIRSLVKRGLLVTMDGRGVVEGSLKREMAESLLSGLWYFLPEKRWREVGSLEVKS